MNKQFVRQKMRKIIQSYTNDSPIPLAPKEEKALIDYALFRYKQQQDESLYDMLHDLCYEVFTDSLTFDEIACQLKAQQAEGLLDKE